MDKTITEEQIKNLLNDLLLEQASKVSRNDFNRVQFKMEELQNSLNETIKEFRKLNDSIPAGLKTVTNGRLSNMSLNLSTFDKLLSQLKNKVKQSKRSVFAQPSPVEQSTPV